MGARNNLCEFHFHFDSFLTSDFKKPTYFTFIFNASSGYY